ncbi:MAG: proline dehydrogenase family protein, partial [Steroidobacteraceae bacterium]
MTAGAAAQGASHGHDARSLAQLRERLRAATLRPESGASGEMLAELGGAHAALAGAAARAARWVEVARSHGRSRPLVDRMLEQFPLDSAQGKALMSLAEALLRTPDPKRADQLIAERLAAIRKAGVPSDTALLLRTGFALLGAAGRLLPDVAAELSGEFSAASLTKPVIAPVVRAALRQSMQLLGHAFIVGETIDAALERGRSEPELALCSFDVLGEGARTESDAQRYFESYAHAIQALGEQPPGAVHARSGISVKLSALEPRYTLLQSARVDGQLAPRMLELARRAAGCGIGFTVDAEEADRLDLSLGIVETLARDAGTRGWEGLGLAVQAYGRRAPLVLDWVAQLARDSGRRMTVRLVKGAYWDSEIKRAQERGLASFPVYTSKAATDASYLECVRRLFSVHETIYPQFATHNAHTVAAVLALAPAGAACEFQRLHGMGEALYEAARAEVPTLPPVRVYAPVGTNEDLLPYLVRRLLENGANSSFVHQFMNPQIPVEQVVRDPISSLSAEQSSTAPRVREPATLYGSERTNSAGEDFGDPAALAVLEAQVRAGAAHGYCGGPIVSGLSVHEANVPVTSPADSRETVGFTRDATAEEIRHAMAAAAQAQPAWDATPAAERAACLTRAADLLQERRGEFLSLLVREAG